MRSRASQQRHWRRQSRAILLAGATLALSGCGDEETSSGFIGQPIELSVTINEVFALNNDPGVPLSNHITDASGEFAPWIELYNAGDEDAHLGGYWMSNDSRHPKAKLPDEVVVPAGGFFLLWADGDTTETDGDDIHLGFELGSTRGDTVVLFDFEKKWLDQMWAAGPLPGETPEAWARCPDGTGTPTNTGMPTPRKTNESSCL